MRKMNNEQSRRPTDSPFPSTTRVVAESIMALRRAYGCGAAPSNPSAQNMGPENEDIFTALQHEPSTLREAAEQRLDGAEDAMQKLAEQAQELRLGYEGETTSAEMSLLEAAEQMLEAVQSSDPAEPGAQRPDGKAVRDLQEAVERTRNEQEE
jgi:hypothetical protein